MDAIQAARELGKAIQADPRFIRIRLAQDKNDADSQLQKLIDQFNQKREELNEEVRKEDKDSDKIKSLDSQLKDSYARIFENENMLEYSEAKNDFSELLTFINQIINASAAGEDPETVEYQAACGGSCSSCSGCN